MIGGVPIAVANRVLLEVRTYRLRRGAGADFHRLMVEHALPLLREHGIRVVRCGPSEVEDEETVDGYVLVRAFDSVTQRTEQEDRFYGSAEWRDGPRADVLARIESYHTVVLWVHVTAVDPLSAPAELPGVPPEHAG